jgi:multidrug efflux system membrane fusion protein
MPRRLSFLVLISVLLLSSCRKEQTAQTASGPPPVPAAVAVATSEPMPVEVRGVGTVEATQTVEVRSLIEGELVRVGFAEGQDVQQGQVLFEIDSRRYREALRQSEAAVERDRAEIRQAEAALERDQAQLRNAGAEAARYAQLAKEGIVSKSQLDQFTTQADVQRASVSAAQATLERARAALASDLAAVDRAKLELSYCTLRSPIAGRAGALLVHQGNLIRANDTPLVVIHQITPVRVSFNVPEQHAAEIRRQSARRKLEVRVSPKDDPDSVARGELVLIDNAVDNTTGTIRLKARLANADRLLWPGQFVHAVLTLDTIPNATVVPAEAVQTSQTGEFVYVVRRDDTVEVRPVTLGHSIERKIRIESGVEPGDKVVVDGHLRLIPGARIKAVDTSKMDSTRL